MSSLILRRSLLRRAALVTVSAAVLSSGGCVQFAANVLHVIRGPQVPAEFKGLENKRVAVVCTTESGMCSDEVGIRLAGNVRGILGKHLSKTTFVSQEEIDQWTQGGGSSSEDLASIGRGVKADYVMSIQIHNLKLRDGATLYRGRSDLDLTVVDVKKGKPVYSQSLPDYTYPVMAGQSTTETDETKFRRVYLMTVADKLARYFYPHDIGPDVALDATILNY